MRPIVAVEAFPCGQLLLQIHLVAIGEQLVELVTAIGSDGSYPKRELRVHVVDEVDGVGLGIFAFVVTTILVVVRCRMKRG